MRLNININGPMSIMDVYIRTSEAMGIDPDSIDGYDCTKILVAENIYKAVRDYYESNCRTNFQEAFAMDWLCCGPKVEIKLDDDTVVVDDGFVVMEGN